MAIELGRRSFTSSKDLVPGKVVQFTYEGEQKTALVLNPNWKGKMHALSLKVVDLNNIQELMNSVKSNTNPDIIYEQFKNSKYVADRPYRTYLLNKISSLREVYVKYTISYVKPNFELEWGEATRYPEFAELGKDKWMKFAETTGTIVNYSSIKTYLGNTDADTAADSFDTLLPARKARFFKALADGIVEYPIAVKFSNTDYDLMAGNTRLTGLVLTGIDPKLWLIDINNIPK